MTRPGTSGVPAPIAKRRRSERVKVIDAARDRHHRRADAEADEEERRRAGPEVRDRIDRRAKRRGVGDGRCRPDPRAAGRPAAAAPATAVRAADTSSPAIAPASTKAGPRKQREVGAARQRPDVRLDRHPAAPPASRPREPAACSSPPRSSRSRTARCASTRFGDRPQRSAAAIIAMPITLRMSTFRKLMSAPQPSSCDCRRNRNASAKTCSPRSRAIDAAAAWPTFAARADAAIDKRQPGEEQEQRRRQAGDEDRDHVERAAAILGARPRVGDVRADHDDHGDAAQPVEIDLTLQERPRSWCRAAMSWRSECHTEQYLSRDSWMARSTACAGTSPVTTKCSVKLHEVPRRLVAALADEPALRATSDRGGP